MRRYLRLYREPVKMLLLCIFAVPLSRVHPIMPYLLWGIVGLKHVEEILVVAQWVADHKRNGGVGQCNGPQ